MSLRPRAEKTNHERVEHGDWQTPIALAREVVSVVKRFSPRPLAVVEPTCGRGAFLLAAHEAFPNAELFGFEKSPTHVAHAKRALRGTGARVREADFFVTHWETELARLPTPVLILGNPPWVTSAVVGKLGGKNLPPKKGKREGFSGYESITGKSNFDISEWMIRRLLEACVDRDARIAMLCKSTVARRMVAFAHARGLRMTGQLHRIDSRLHFEASVDAVLFVAKPTSRKKDIGRFLVFDSLAARTPSRSMGIVDGRVSADTEAFAATRFLERTPGEAPELEWRSGLKHDCAAVMELRVSSTDLAHLTNGLGETVSVEDERVYPLLKGSDVANGRGPGRRAVLVSQRALGESTLALAESAPRTFAYLKAHEDALAARKSRIYVGRPPFAIFGVGAYTFAPYKVAICGLYKRVAFQVIGPLDGKPVMVDDTIMFLPFDEHAMAERVARALNGDLARTFFEARVFWDEKRPLGKALLSTLSLRKLLEVSAEAPRSASGTGAD